MLLLIRKAANLRVKLEKLVMVRYRKACGRRLIKRLQEGSESARMELMRRERVSQRVGFKAFRQAVASTFTNRSLTLSLDFRSHKNFHFNY